MIIGFKVLGIDYIIYCDGWINEGRKEITFMVFILNNL